MSAYYSEIDPFAADWLRELIKEGLIAPGEVDERDIRDVHPSDLRGFRQCHFFAGIGGWSYALRLAGWPDDEPVWSGSCPCQPFAAAGRRGGFADERHLWPALHHLLRECRPPVLFGEQVASPDGLRWLDLVQVDLEDAGYACGALDTCAAGVGAPHLRQRLYFVAHPEDADGRGGASGPLDHAERIRRETGRGDDGCHDRLLAHAAEPTVSLALTHGDERGQVGADAGRGGSGSAAEGLEQRPLHGGALHGFWRDAEWLFCRDGKLRAAQPGIFPLADGVPGRVGVLRGAGNAIVATQAEAFIRAYREVRGLV